MDGTMHEIITHQPAAHHYMQPSSRQPTWVAATDTVGHRPEATSPHAARAAHAPSPRVARWPPLLCWPQLFSSVITISVPESKGRGTRTAGHDGRRHRHHFVAAFAHDTRHTTTRHTTHPHYSYSLQLIPSLFKSRVASRRCRVSPATGHGPRATGHNNHNDIRHAPPMHPAPPVSASQRSALCVPLIEPVSLSGQLPTAPQSRVSTAIPPGCPAGRPAAARTRGTHQTGSAHSAGRRRTCASGPSRGSSRSSRRSGRTGAACSCAARARDGTWGTPLERATARPPGASRAVRPARR